MPYRVECMNQNYVLYNTHVSMPCALQVTAQDLEAAMAAVGEFGVDNRAGVAGTLHRISALRNRRGAIIGLTCRVGRAVSGHTDMLCDLVEGEQAIAYWEKVQP